MSYLQLPAASLWCPETFQRETVTVAVSMALGVFSPTQPIATHWAYENMNFFVVGTALYIVYDEDSFYGVELAADKGVVFEGFSNLEYISGFATGATRGMVAVNRSSLEGIADALRTAHANNEKYKPSEMAAAITGVHEAGKSAAAAECQAKHFTTVIEGDGGDTLSFNVPFEPDLISVTGYDPTVLLEENNAMQLIYDLRAFGIMGGMVLISMVNSSKLAALTSVSALSRYSREADGTVTIRNIKDTGMKTGGIFRPNVMYSVSAVKYTDKTDRQRITAMVERLTGKGSLTVNRAKVNAAFTDEEWAALIATKPDWTFAFIG